MKLYQIVIAVVAVALIIAGIVILLHNSNFTQQVNVSKVVFPTQSQISSTLGKGWNITGLYEENYSNAVYQQYPGATSLYQEYIQKGNQSVTIDVLQLNTTTTLKGIKVGKYLILANITGNSTPFDLSKLESLEVETLRDGNGLTPTLNPLLIPANQTITLLEFGNATTQNYTLYFETISYNNYYTTIDIAKSSNITYLFNYLLMSAGQNVTISSINGAKYFNLSFVSQYGGVYYTVGMKDNYLVFVQSQSSQAFQFFIKVINEV
ncbi:hypothetical protein V6M85_07100 [Sulfolobus tengchongensis]|uniref:Uncharacterized protein n=1 Tax=Sulfolobus tengchongensis TaxID=207809 RepID=A0AAX4KY63_9CREN